tara:strand:- start:1392 stop:1709 length:318 start_codon:yes stop_codon:yes gene_type:complete
MQTGDQFYARKLVNNILSRDYTISVNDGEEWTVVDSRLEAKIMDALMTTDEDRIKFKDPLDYKTLGNFYLVYGNDPSGKEVISDYTDNRMCDQIWQEVVGKELDL